MINQNDKELQTRVSLDISRRYDGNDIAVPAAPTTLDAMLNIGGYNFNDQSMPLKEEEVINGAIYNRALFIIKQGISSYMKRLSDIDKDNFSNNVNTNGQVHIRTIELANLVNSFITNINYTNISNTSEIKRICATLSDAYNIDLSNFIFHLTRRLLSSLRADEISELINAIFNSLTFYNPKHNDGLQIKTWASSIGAEYKMFDNAPWLLVVILLVDAPFNVVSQIVHKGLVIQINIG